MKPQQLKIIIGLIFMVSSSFLLSQEPTVKNVRFTQREDMKVEVTYDLIGKPGRKYTVKLSLTKSGSRAILPMSRAALSGDIGDGVVAGRLRRIVWNLPKDYPQGLEGEDFVFVVQVFEQGGGGSKTPWIIAGLVAAAGGGAVYLLLGKEKPPETGSIIIDVSGN